MAINQSGTLYTLLEGTVTGDPTKTLRIDEFIATEKYTGRRFIYTLIPTDQHRRHGRSRSFFIVLERNGAPPLPPRRLLHSRRCI
jgi:hypothetical protein